GCCRSNHSFPTRRSSDLHVAIKLDNVASCLKDGFVRVHEHGSCLEPGRCHLAGHRALPNQPVQLAVTVRCNVDRVGMGRHIGWRSEEHTSELQSRENLVC